MSSAVQSLSVLRIQTFHLCTNFTWVIFAFSNRYLCFLFVSVLSASFYCCEDKGDVFES